MGCFNVAGTMSNLTIGHGDKTAFFILSKPKEHYRIKSFDDVGTSLSSNEGACILSQPYCPPIFGEYNDYGCLENIIENKTTKDLEEYFGLDIETLVTAICRGGYDEYPELNIEDDDLHERRREELKTLSGMFEHTEVVEQMSSHFYQHAFDESYFTDTVMRKMGFEFVGKEVDERSGHSPQRYNQKWVKDNIVMFTDGTWKSSNIIINDIVFDVSSAYKPSSIAELVGISHWSFGYESSVALAMEEYDKKLEDLKTAKENLKKAKLEGSNQEKLDAIISDMPCLFMDRYPVRVENIKIGSNEERELLHHFTSAMFSTNNFYFPAMSGEQHGNSEADLKLNRVCSKILYDKLDGRDYE